MTKSTSATCRFIDFYPTLYLLTRATVIGHPRFVHKLYRPTLSLQELSQRDTKSRLSLSRHRHLLVPKQQRPLELTFSR